MERAEINESPVQRIVVGAKFAAFVTTCALHVSALKLVSNAKYGYAWASYGVAMVLRR